MRTVYAICLAALLLPLMVADAATPRDEPIGFTFLVNGEEAAKSARAEYEKLRKSGELAKILERMQLE